MRNVNNELFVFPNPPSALSSPEIHDVAVRTSKIVCNYESPDTGQITWISLTFGNRYAVKVTNEYACDLDALSKTSGKVVDLGGTKWLKEIKSNLSSNAGMRKELKHLVVFFEHNCLYEFICESFHVSVDESPSIAVQNGTEPVR